MIAETAEQAAAATNELGGRSVVKVQVQVGGRGKGGGVVLVDSPQRAAEEAGRMLGSDFQGHEVTRVLCEELLPLKQEFYTSVLLDRSSGDYLFLMTAEGGMDIETLAIERPEALRRVHVDPMLGLRTYHVRDLTETLPLQARDGAGDIVRKMFEMLREEDATLVEINPLVLLEDGRVVALDAKVTIDDNALFRRPATEALKEQFPIDPVEKRAKDAGLQYVKLDGAVGIIGNGAGLVMSTLDVVAQAGARAANFLDVGGGASADTMATSLEVILSDPAVKAVFINIFGGITRCDVVANGVLETLKRVEATVPLVVRLDGTNAEEGRRILSEAAHPQIFPAATMLEAAQRAADLANGGVAA
jgi:succinyl-CoA synthetase beta subunit